jgi:hypothetical protein
LHAVGEAFGLDGLTGTDLFSAGFGWRARAWNGHRMVETGGDLPGYTNLLLLIPERRIGMWIANNSGKNAITLGYLWAFLDRFFPAKRPQAAPGPLPAGWDSLSAFVVGIIAYFAVTPSYELMLGLSPVLRAILVLPLISLALTVLTLPAFTRAARGRSVATGVMATHAVFVASATGFLMFLNHWNLLGYRG